MEKGKVSNDVLLAQQYIDRGEFNNVVDSELRKYLTALRIGEDGSPKSTKTIKNRIFGLCRFFKYQKNIPSSKDITKEHILEFVSKLMDEGVARTTIANYKVTLRIYFTWLYQTDETPKMVAWIKKEKTQSLIDPSKLWYPNEIKQLVSVCKHPRDKALLMGLYESGARKSEFIGLKIKDIHFDNQQMKISVNGKTGKRNISLIDSIPYIRLWYENHPCKNDMDAYFFVNFSSGDYKPLGESSVNDILNDASKKAGFSKRIYPHLFRHSRLTWLAQECGFNERDLRIFAGWSKTSDMPNTYLHYGEEEVHKKLRIASGIEERKEDTEQKEALKPIKCPRCERINPADSHFCNCGQALTQKACLNLDKAKQYEEELIVGLMTKDRSELPSSITNPNEIYYELLKKDPVMIDTIQKLYNIVKEVNG
jgi:integrase/recombinase XerD